jgi:hypothetical protein
MPPTDCTFEDVIDIVSEEYGMCVKKARELFTDEQAIQSASATMFINATKEKSSVGRLLKSLNTKIENIDKEAIPSAISVWKWHFRDYLKEFPNLEDSLIHYVGQAMSPRAIEVRMKERYFALKCNGLDKDAQDALERELFGEVASNPATPSNETSEKKEDPVDPNRKITQPAKTPVGNEKFLMDSRIHIATSPKDFVTSVMESPVFSEPDDEYFSGNAYW